MGKLGRKVLMLPLLVCSLAASPSHAQEESEPPQLSEDPCRVTPEDAEPEDQENGEGQRKRQEELAEMLDRCNGILTPPDVGANDMVEPPPDAGRTPIIRPRELPDQQPGPENPNSSDG